MIKTRILAQPGCGFFYLQKQAKVSLEIQSHFDSMSLQFMGLHSRGTGTTAGFAGQFDEPDCDLDGRFA
jgi:hypothetical protein